LLILETFVDPSHLALTTFAKIWIISPETISRYREIYTDGTFRREPADAEITGNLWVAMIDEIKGSFGINRVSSELMQKLFRITKTKAPAFLEKIAGKQC